MKITAALRAAASALPPPHRVLDVGCGPASWLWNIGLRPVGLDITESYVAQFREQGDASVVGSCVTLPFATGSFDQAWSVGLLHHLTDQMARDTIAEMLRVVGPSGAVLIVDAVLPRSALTRPLAYVLRKLDRGGNVRTEAEHRALFGAGWQTTRHLMAYNGLEFTFSVLAPR